MKYFQSYLLLSLSLIWSSLSFALEPVYDSSGQLITIPPEPPKTIAIYGFEAHGLTGTQLEIFVNQLSTSLIKTGHFQVLERKRMDAILQEQGFSSSGTTAETIEMGKMLKVDYIISGSFAKSSGRYYGTADLINTQTAQVEHSARIEGKSGEAEFVASRIPLLARMIEDPSIKLIYPPLKSAAWITSGVSVLTLGAGLFFENQAQTAFFDFKKNPNQRTLDEVRTQQNLRNIAYWTAGGLAIGSIVMWFWPEDEPTTQIRKQKTVPLALSPYFHPNDLASLGLQIQGGF